MLNYPPSASEHTLRQAIIECGRICYERGLMVSTDGNLSVRLEEDRVLITPSGVSKGRLRDEDLLIIDLEGTVRKSAGSYQPSSETPMHLEVYKNRIDARAVIHAHPVFATALTVAGMPLPSDVLPEVLLTLGEVPVAAYATPSTSEDAEAIRTLIGEHVAILLSQHGALTTGVDLEEALVRLERIEHVAEVFWRAHALGRVKRLSHQARRRLLAARGNDIKR